MRVAGPRLRDSQGQVVVFLPAGERDGVRDAAYRHGLSLGETLAVAINVEFAAMGVPAPLTPGCVRGMRRTRAVAAPRGEACRTPSRRGLSSLAAWYDRREVRDLRELCRECGRSLQDVARCGIGRLDATGALAAYVAEAARLRSA